MYKLCFIGEKLFSHFNRSMRIAWIINRQIYSAKKHKCKHAGTVYKFTNIRIIIKILL